MYQFKRYTGISLGDQLNNPMALNIGLFADRYDGLLSYEATNGNHTAVFATMAQGVAAGFDRMLSDIHDYPGCTIRDYITGGGDIPVWKSYSGGQNYESYLRAIDQHGFPEEMKMVPELDFLGRMVDAHALAEGVKYRLNKEDEELAWTYIQHRSPNL